MYIAHLSLTNYRNFGNLRLDLPPGMVVLLGDNGEGKSNLLEAAYLLSIAKSYRTNTERELVSWQAQHVASEALEAVSEQTIVSAEVDQGRERLRIVVGLRLVAGESPGGLQVQKQIRVDGVATTATALVGQVNAVLFTATDVDLVLGPPAGRRRFLDILISQVDRGYLRTLQRYQRVLSQRNHLLRQVRERRAMPDELDFWDGELVKEGGAIVRRRQEVIEWLSPLAKKSYEGLAPGEALAMEYEASVRAETLAVVVADQRDADVRSGVTGVGPHRDDLALTVDGMPAASYASRGQARTIALALRLAEAMSLRKERRQEPILLLDDVLSELDPRRRRRVLEEAATYQQAIVTTAEPALVGDAPAPPAAMLRVERGRVVREG